MVVVAILFSLFCISQVSFCRASSSSFSLHNPYLSNGVIQLIIEAYTEEILREMSSRRDLHLNHAQSILLRQRMRGLYDHIKHHPALYQRYLWVGKGRPDIDPDLLHPAHGTKKFQTKASSKRKRYLDGDESGSITQVSSRSESSPSRKQSSVSRFPAEEICKTRREWEQVNKTYDLYENQVEVIQDTFQQYVFTYRCVSEAGPCIGISHQYESECTERYGWMYMYYRKVDDPDQIPQWGFVSAAHHCACKITPKIFPDL